MVSSGVLLSKRYRLDERIATGGMGDVWKGTDEVLDRTVAIKIMLTALLEERGFVERFRTEARTMATINHPGVVRIYDFGHDEVAYLIMEYVEGEPLSRTLNRVGRLTPARTMSLVAQAAEALEAAHEKGVIHRDVKPGNLLVRPNGTLILTDFGIARSAAAAQLTATGAVLGTASYLSPEQASGQPATPASDVYSLGVVAYQCLSGSRPYEGDTPLEIAMKHVNGTARPLAQDVPVPIRQVVERAMAKEPAKRWKSAAEFAVAARRAATLPAHPPTVQQQVKPAAGNVPFQRGVAQAPPAPPPRMPVNTYQQPALVKPAAPDSTGRSRLAVVWVVLAMITVLVCSALAGYWAKQQQKRGNQAMPAGVTMTAAQIQPDYSAHHQTEGLSTR
ncbi:serine/threonine-protein kinase [Catelliglobosispora koreensis]|uniref:serine/threonine-protein kinase n=1 Tax=Catelliglobosispora koreensis TaxID=129052 RepID=UPI0003613145|nr:serine/threonine-protein kinase [Catelliglobosispora koreensis]